MESYTSAYQQSLNDPNSYWTEVGKSFRWHRPWNEVTRGNFDDLNIEWFVGGELNITENCLDRHRDQHPDKIALIFEPNDPRQKAQTFTYAELTERVCQMANFFSSQGVKKGDVLCFYMGMVPELLIGVLACARIGAIHSVVFGGFSAKALAGRIQDCSARFLMTNDYGLRGEKRIPLKRIADEALAECTSVEKVFLSARTDSLPPLNLPRDVHLQEHLDQQPKEFAPVMVDSEHPLFILYTSGSTGQPKGLLHTTGGYMVGAAHSFANVFQMNDEQDVFWCTADIGWITGHSYLTYGPLLNGVTNLMFEGIPTYPDGGRFWDVIDRHKVTHFYTAPTAIRALEALPIELVESRDLSSLKVLGTVGEPINEEAWEWYHEKIGKGRCPIVDTWWQTETGSILISPIAYHTPQKPGYATLPMPGVEPLLMDADGKPLSAEGAVSGNLCLKRPWPSMARTIYGDHQRFRDTYFKAYPGHYFTGDGARRDDQGHYRITGRVDDVINVSGHRIGTAEVEEAINEHPAIIESAVAGIPHPIKGQGLYAYAITDGPIKDSEELKREVNDLITKIIGPIAKVDFLHVTTGLPKTRSGKIMRRILRKVAEGDTQNLGDTSTLLNPEIVEELIKGRVNLT